MQPQPAHLICPECGAAWPEGNTCQDAFHQMLAWEWQIPALAPEVHFLMVLGYHLQHPSLYSPEGLAAAIALLRSYVEDGSSLDEIRARSRSEMGPGKRKWKLRGTPGASGAYQQRPAWTMTVAGVIDGGMDAYGPNVRAWAQSIYAVLSAMR